MKALWILSAWIALGATAQETAFPQRGPLEITVLFPAGSSADVTARMLADGMSRHLSQRVLVEGPAKRNAAELAARTGNNRVVNFAAADPLTNQFVDLKITAALSHSLRGVLV